MLNNKRFLNVVCSIFVSLLLVGLSVIPSFASSDGGVVLQNNSTETVSNTLELNERTETTVLSVSANSTSGLHSLVLSLIGDYNPVVTDHIYYSTNYNGNQVANHNVEIEPDWSWIISACIFALVLYSVLRIIGVVIGGLN